MSFRTKTPSGATLDVLWAVFKGNDRITHWDARKDNTLAAFWRSNDGKKLRRTKSTSLANEFSVRAQRFIRPPKEAAQ